jgi:hypothetical protein
MLTTPRLSLQYPQSTDDANAFPAVSAEQMTVLDNAVLFTKGTLSARPSSGFVAGRVYYATDTFQYFDDNGSAWVPRVIGYPSRGYRAGALTLESGAITPVPIDTITTDVGSCFSGGSYLVPHAGVFLVMANVQVYSGGTGFLFCMIYKNGAELTDGGECPSGSGASCDYASNLSDIVVCAAGDVLELVVYNATDTNLSMDVSGVASAGNYFAIQPLA